MTKQELIRGVIKQVKDSLLISHMIIFNENLFSLQARYPKEKGRYFHL